MEPAVPLVRRRHPGRVKGWRAALAALGVAGVVGSGVFGAMWAHLQGQIDDQAAARLVASRFLEDLTNFDAPSVAADFRAIASLATSPFSSQVQQVFNARIRRELVAAHARTRGRIIYLAVQSYAGGSASVYAEVDQTATNDQSPSAQTDQLRMVLGLKKVAGSWKVSTVTTLGSSSALGG